jgi:phosphoserine phosphatase
MGASPIQLVAFDLDGTLSRGDTVCEAIARGLGHLDRMRELEAVADERRDRESLRSLREELAAYYRGTTATEPCACLGSLALAPGAREGFDFLRRRGIATAIVSITWEFAAAWLARELGADHHVGTRLLSDGGIEHVWPEDKGRWVARLAQEMGLRREQTAAVGDSWRDLPMFGVVGQAYYVGETLPPGLRAIHVPDGDIREIARLIAEAPGAGQAPVAGQAPGAGPAARA